MKKKKKTLGQKIREAREEKGLTRTELGKITGKGYEQVRHWEEGIREPKIATLKLICEATDCSILWLIEDL